MQRKLMLISSSAIFGAGYLDYCAEQLTRFLTQSSVKKVLFVPYALKDYEGYAKKVKDRFEKMGYEIESVHHCSDPIVAVEKACNIYWRR